MLNRKTALCLSAAAVAAASITLTAFAAEPVPAQPLTVSAVPFSVVCEAADAGSTGAGGAIRYKIQIDEKGNAKIENGGKITLTPSHTASVDENGDAYIVAEDKSRVYVSVTPAG